MMHKFIPATHLSNLSDCLLLWIKFILMQPVVPDEGRISGRQLQAKTEKDLSNIMVPNPGTILIPHWMSFRLYKNNTYHNLRVLHLSIWCWCVALHTCPQSISSSRLLFPLGTVHIPVDFYTRISFFSCVYLWFVFPLLLLAGPD